MNKQRMLELADKLEKLPPQNFDMGDWSITSVGYKPVCEDDATECGTTCCIAGWQQVFAGHCLVHGRVYAERGNYDPTDWYRNFLGYAEDLAKDDLGLDYDQKDRLFYRRNWPVDQPLEDNPEYFTKLPNTPQGAAARIRQMVKEAE